MKLMNLGIDTQTNSNEYCSYIFSPELIDKNCFTIQEPMPLAPTLATPVRQKAPAQDNDLSSAKVARPEEQWTRAGALLPDEPSPVALTCTAARLGAPQPHFHDDCLWFEKAQWNLFAQFRPSTLPSRDMTILSFCSGFITEANTVEATHYLHMLFMSGYNNLITFLAYLDMDVRLINYDVWI